MHPDYQPAGLTADLALHFLEYDTGLPAAPLALPVVGDAIVQGYGLDEYGDSGSIRETVVSVDKLVRNHKILTAPGPDSCYGDSGGPMYQDGALVGVVSSGLSGKDCGDGGLYTAPLAFTEWLEYHGVNYTLKGQGCSNGE
jgi:hypothetical protein